MENVVKVVVGFLGATASFLFGGWSVLLQILVLFIALDYLLGVLIAAMHGKLNSDVGFRGIAKKVIILALVAVGHAIDQIIGGGSFVRDAIIFFYLTNELLSILETVGKTNIPIPNVLKKAIEMLNQKGEGK